ncbi:pair-rule protein odd-paired [Bradysia coprophila]|uniref:pair-rule protein odd-paired n=1 Tax=Bradysia coprophila TaxID=38358 RepID=UPI00187D8E75|nr:pair-rule protein odd-paired [Bradysia coprophila]
MAVFLINICKFNGCGITFPSLGDLIQHIEDTHIDYDPQVIEQKEQSRPQCLPLSYVLRFITDAARREGPFLGSSGAELKRKLAIKHHSYSMSSSNRSNTPTDHGSEMDEDEMIPSELEDSNDSWTTEEFSSEFIMRYGSRHSVPTGNSSSNEKPFACPVPGCKKRYKNVNGIKYHSKNGHKKDGKVRKGYKCHCGKSYKTSQGLKSHSVSSHNNNSTILMTNVTDTININNNNHASRSAASPPSGSLDSSASNMSGSCSSSINQSQLSPNSSFSSSTAATNTQTMKNNFGLISIKAKPSSSASSSSASSGFSSKLVKLYPDKQSSSPDAGSIVKMTGHLPSLVNLGILTPATSPKQQPINQLMQNNNDVILPLTPISPNMSKNVNFNNITVADHITTTDET